MSRSQKPHEVHIQKIIGLGADLPPIFALAHRHFEKSNPMCSAKQATLIVPLDLLDFLAPVGLLDKIESIEVTYRKD